MVRLTKRFSLIQDYLSEQDFLDTFLQSVSYVNLDSLLAEINFKKSEDRVSLDNLIDLSSIIKLDATDPKENPDYRFSNESIHLFKRLHLIDERGNHFMNMVSIFKIIIRVLNDSNYRYIKEVDTTPVEDLEKRLSPDYITNTIKRHNECGWLWAFAVCEDKQKRKLATMISKARKDSFGYDKNYIETQIKNYLDSNYPKERRAREEIGSFSRLNTLLEEKNKRLEELYLKYSNLYETGRKQVADLEGAIAELKKEYNKDTERIMEENRQLRNGLSNTEKELKRYKKRWELIENSPELKAFQNKRILIIGGEPREHEYRNIINELGLGIELMYMEGRGEQIKRTTELVENSDLVLMCDGMSHGSIDPTYDTLRKEKRWCVRFDGNPKHLLLKLALNYDKLK